MQRFRDDGSRPRAASEIQRSERRRNWMSLIRQQLDSIVQGVIVQFIDDINDPLGGAAADQLHCLDPLDIVGGGCSLAQR
jgi:hypothetical protein